MKCVLELKISLILLARNHQTVGVASMIEYVIGHELMPQRKSSSPGNTWLKLSLDFSADDILASKNSN